jgi:hypothetical protein
MPPGLPHHSTRPIPKNGSTDGPASDEPNLRVCLGGQDVRREEPAMELLASIQHGFEVLVPA